MKDLIEFVTQKETPPTALKEAARKDVVLSFRGPSIIKKFLFFQFIGAAFSMTVCPQFGMGLVEGHGITHAFRMIGDWACAGFCGSLFLSAGAITAFVGMKGEELWWVWRRYKFSLVLLPPVMWGMLMLGNVSLNLSSEAVSYHLVWIATAMLAQAAWLQVRAFMVGRNFSAV